MTAVSLQFWIDRGGTFTDCIGCDPQGRLSVVKVPSSDEAPLVGIRALLGLAPDDPIPPCEVRMGTTVATNALLERRGKPVGLVITEGLSDLLRIGDQSRPDIFALAIEQPTPLYAAVLPVRARAGADGRVAARDDAQTLRRRLAALRQQVSSVAVVVLHGHRAPELEREIGALARQVGFADVALSHEIAAEIGMLGRGDTTVVDAYLTPLLREYLARLATALPGSTLRLMKSSGGLSEAGAFRGRDAILSGPAGGVVACTAVAEQSGIDAVIGLDMGGTSTDVCRAGIGEAATERTYETRVAGVRLRTPMLAVHTVAAGGGSICRFDGMRLSVGPDSAGADPGPLCYGRAEATELTLTDVALALGRVQPDRFVLPLTVEPVERALRQLRAAVAATGDGRDARSLAEGFVRIAVEHMAAAIHRISIAKGHDVRRHALVVFGGAGGQYAGLVARQLGIRTLLFHPLAGVLSAYGMGLAARTWHGEADLGRAELSEASVAAARSAAAALVVRGREALGDGDARVELQLRYRGTETAIGVALDGDVHALRERFEAAHRRELGWSRTGHAIEAATVRVEVSVGGAEAHVPAPVGDEATVEAVRTARLFVGGRELEAGVYERERIAVGGRLVGPAIVVEATGTIVVEPGFSAVMRGDGVLVVTDDAGASPSAASRASSGEGAGDAVLLELYANRFMAVAEQMGTVLRRTALSTNIRERLDFSCAVFDAGVGLVANAPHQPVHLGAMGESVAAVAAAHPEPAPGDVFATNDPAAGGSHLPDITVVTPVHVAGRVAFFVASRGHHADVGGITPGSMPPHSRTLAEEGVVFRADRIVAGDVLDLAVIERVLGSGPYPARTPADNIADLQAQVAANRTGARLLGQLVQRHGADEVAAYMQHVQDHATAAVADAIAQLPDGEVRFEDRTDDDVPIAVRLRVAGSRLEVDFTGTGAAVPGNTNAPRAVTVAAVLYVLRALVGRPIPLNKGCLRPVALTIPPGSMLDPPPDAAVAGGNVETAQRVVDVLLGALGVKAACQGTMNNLTFGNDRFGYYETIGGGEGGSDGHPGASGVHTHMTNTRITDPEILEARFGVRLLRFEIRTGSGGPGRFPGGDGLVRSVQALTPLSAAILSDRRVRPPFGLHGGGAGRPGKTVCRRSDGTEETLSHRAAIELAPGDTITLYTPGGGGFGR